MRVTTPKPDPEADPAAEASAAAEGANRTEEREQARGRRVLREALKACAADTEPLLQALQQIDSRLAIGLDVPPRNCGIASGTCGRCWRKSICAPTMPAVAGFLAGVVNEVVRGHPTGMQANGALPTPPIQVATDP